MIILRNILKVLLALVILFVIFFAVVIVYAVISDYKPKATEVVYNSDKPDMLTDSAKITLLSWNIGYCGLDRKMDFFYDGGRKVITPKPQFIENMKAVDKFLSKNDSMDFIFIQEIDKNSKRSYHFNEYDTLDKSLHGYYPFFAKNYDVFFVPVPLSNPMGKVISGLAMFSKYRPASSVRYSFPGKYGFPKQLFMLDRCFLMNRYPLTDGRELIVINTHNEAFDPGEIRKAQMSYLKNFLLSEYAKGNYIITGGDWNMSPPGFVPRFTSNKVLNDQMKMESDFFPDGWEWVYDDKTPSNRSVIAAYDPAVTGTTVIDIFLLSPNIRDISVECINLGFENSDHNPVRVKVRLLK